MWPDPDHRLQWFDSEPFETSLPESQEPNFKLYEGCARSSSPTGMPEKPISEKFVWS